MTVWTIDMVADRFCEAATTAHQLPPARVAGYVTLWPEIARQAWEGYADETVVVRIPATPAAIDRLAQTTQWLQWLSEEQRTLIWARARYVPWRAICERFGWPRQTARRRWQHALALIVVELNGERPRIVEVGASTADA